MKQYWYHLISLIVLIVFLVMGRSPESAAIWAIAATIATSFLSKDRKEWLTPRNLIKATIDSAQNMVPVAALLAAAGLIVGTFSLTGLGLKISSLIMSLSGGIPVLALFLALVASMIIGLSLPITATYIMTVVMVAPALVKVGIPEHVAHLLAFYFAVLSEVSPPVGLSPSAAAAVTGGNPFGSMMQAWKYSLPAFLVPFLFSSTLTGANLLIIGANIQGFILALITSTFSLFFVSVGVIGFIKSHLLKWERTLLIISAIIITFIPIGFSPQGIIPMLVGIVIVVLHIKSKKQINSKQEA